MSCLVCKKPHNLQMPIMVDNDLLIDGELQIRKFCYRCMYVISKSYKNLLQANVSNLQAFHLVQEMLDGAE